MLDCSSFRPLWMQASNYITPSSLSELHLTIKAAEVARLELLE